VLALGTAQRNIAAALLVGEQNFIDPNVVVMLIVVAAVGMLIPFPLVRVVAKRSNQQEEAARRLSRKLKEFYATPEQGGPNNNACFRDLKHAGRGLESQGRATPGPAS
jgi:hypothetical protein